MCDCLCKCLHTGIFKDFCNSQFNTKLLPNHCNQSHHCDGVAAQIKEIILCCNIRKFQNLCKYFRNLTLIAVHRFFWCSIVMSLLLLLLCQCCQIFSVNLSICCQSDFWNPNDKSRHFIGRKVLREVLIDFCFLQIAFTGIKQNNFHTTSLYNCCCRICDAAATHCRNLNFSKLNPESIDFNLIIHSAKEFNFSICMILSLVPGKIEPFAIFTSYEFLCGQRCISKIFLCQTFSTDVDESRCVFWANLKLLIKHIHLLIIKRISIRNADPIRFNKVNWIIIRPNCRFCCTAQTDYHSMFKHCSNFLRQIQWNPVPAEHHRFQLVFGLLFRVLNIYHHLHQRWHTIPYSYFCFFDDFAPATRFFSFFCGRNNHCTTCIENSKNIIDRQIKVQFREHECSVRSTNSEFSVYCQ